MQSVVLLDRLLSASHNPNQSQEQDDNIHIQRCRRIDGIIDGSWNVVRPRPVITDITAEYQYNHPVDDGTLGFEDKDHHQFNNNGADQSNGQSAGNALEKSRIHGSEQHHDDSDGPGRLNCVHNNITAVTTDDQINDQPEGATTSR